MYVMFVCLHAFDKHEHLVWCQDGRDRTLFTTALLLLFGLNSSLGAISNSLQTINVVQLGPFYKTARRKNWGVPPLGNMPFVCTKFGWCPIRKSSNMQGEYKESENE